jgi:hypothetical protein
MVISIRPVELTLIILGISMLHKFYQNWNIERRLDELRTMIGQLEAMWPWLFIAIEREVLTYDRRINKTNEQHKPKRTTNPEV